MGRNSHHFLIFGSVITDEPAAYWSLYADVVHGTDVKGVQDRIETPLFYNHAYFVYNISMVVKNRRSPLEQIRALLIEQNGILRTADLADQGIPRTYLSILEKKGEIQRISRGIYVAAGEIPDEMNLLQARYRQAIFSHETALYLWDLTDRTPLFYSVTVPARYNATSLKAGGAKVYFVRGHLLRLGMTTQQSPHGNPIKTYNLERTICDMLRSRHQIDIQFLNQALRRYVNRPDKNLNILYQYSIPFRLQKIVRQYLEVLL